MPVGYERCGFANAFYELDDGIITPCDELAQYVFELYRAPAATGESLDDATASQVTASTMAFVLYHEIGHALAEELDLPLLGNIESGADSIAAVISVETGNSIYAVLGAALFAEEPASFADLHGGGQDRAGDLICWALGGDSRLVFNEAFQPFVNEFAIAGRDCTAEYAAQRRVVLDALPGLGALPEAFVSPAIAAAMFRID